MVDKEREIMFKIMKIKEKQPECEMFGGWMWYFDKYNIPKFDSNRSGKWMIFNKDIEFLNRLCSEAVKQGIVWEAKVSCIPKDDTHVSCFYLHVDDNERHRRIIQFFLDNGAIERTSKGNYKNIAYKLDSQTRNKEYGSGFTAKLNLDRFIDLKTGKFLSD